MRDWSLGLIVVVALCLMLPGEAQEESSDSRESVSCDGRWRGLAFEKVKAGDEHCGLLDRQRKEAALAAACTLAESRHDELAARAESKAWSKVDALGKRESCICTGSRREWENVFTHVFSQRCWTECGQAFLIECQPEEPGN